MKHRSSHPLVGALSLAIIALVVCAASTASARPPKLSEAGHMGAGVGIGALGYGLSGKYYLETGRAVQVNLGPFFTGDRRRYGDIWTLGGDYIFEMSPLSSTREIDLIWALGPGLAAGVSGQGIWLVDVNLCAGFIFQFHDLPLDFAIEYRPGIRFKPPGFLDSPGRATPSFLSAGLQLRYYFR